METLLDSVARRMVEWLWAPPKGMPMEEEDYAQWIKPEGKPLSHRRWKRPLAGRGSRGPIPRRIDEFYHRGAYERHEIHTRPAKKGGLRFRGKGAKVERRHGKRIKK